MSDGTFFTRNTHVSEIRRDGDVRRAAERVRRGVNCTRALRRRELDSASGRSECGAEGSTSLLRPGAFGEDATDVGSRRSEDLNGAFVFCGGRGL